MSSGANVSDTRYTQSNDVLEPILSELQYKSPGVTFVDDMIFTKGATGGEFFFGISELDTRKFDNYEGFSTSPSVGPFGPNHVYATKHHLISISLSISTILPTAYSIASLF